MTGKHGSCLCGACTFEVAGPVRGVGQCHCSLCRKSSGSNGNAIFLVPVERFTWLQGEDHQTTYTRPNSKWSISRCSTCGSPMPRSYDGKQVWVVAGLMDDPLEVGIEMHIFCGSKADWDFESETALSFEEFPS